MAGTQGGLTTSIRRKLQDGKTPEEIIQELVAGGLTELSAQRFVDRAVAEDSSAPALPPLSQSPEGIDSVDQFGQTVVQPEADTVPVTTGRKRLLIASMVMFAAVAIAGISYVMAEPGEPIEEEESADTPSAAPEGVAFSNYLPGEGPSIKLMLAHFEAVNNAEVRCDVARLLGEVPADQAPEAITGLMGFYPNAGATVQDCIRTTVSKLDPKVRFPTTGSR
jgi:hypothetical protein